MVPFRLNRCVQQSGRCRGGIHSKMAADWSDLLPEILNSIAKEIYVYEHLQAFMGVCTSWRSAVTEDKTFIPPLVSRFPSLLLAESKVKEEEEYRQRFLLSGGGGGGMGKLHLPEACNQRLVSSCGWLMTAAEDEIHAKLLHPYTRVQIDLPKLSTLPDYSLVDCWNNNTLRKVVLTSSDPLLDLSCRVVVVYGGICKLGFCKPGDDSWTGIEKGLMKGAYVYDIIYHYGRKRLYGVGRLGEIFEGDLYGSSPITMCELYDGSRELLEPLYGGPYLVEWDDDSLLIVTREFDDYDFGDDDYEEEEEEEEQVFEIDRNRLMELTRNCNIPTIGFSVHQFSFEDGKLTELDDLGGKALFLGYNSSFAVDGSGDGTVRGNCIYFTDDGYEVPGNVGGRDMGIYDYVNDTIQPISYEHPLQDSQSLVSPPLWLAPPSIT